MKVCPNCNNTVEDGAIFCDKCGTRCAVQNNNPVNYPQQPVNQPNSVQQPQYNNYGANQPQFQNSPQTPPKKKNTGMIIGIVAAVLIVLAIIGSVAQKAFQDQGYGDGGNDYTPSYNFSTNDSSTNDNTNSTTDNNASDVKSYNKGSMKDGWYVNEWANMRFDTNGWTLATDDMLAVFETDPKTECGLMINNPNTNVTMLICFENLNGQAVTEKEYIDILKNSFTSNNPTAEAKDGYTTKIADKDFQTLKCSKSESAEGYRVQGNYVYEQDGYMIVVVVEAFSDFDLNSAINNIRTIK